jgi:F0F1-type ATP synthase assembly protein I
MQNDRDDDRDDDRKAARQMRRAALDFGSVGIQFGVATALGYFIGAWLDRRWGTAPWLALTLALCGVASAFRDLIRLTRRAQREAEADVGPHVDPRRGDGEGSGEEKRR